jgi:hypothetical protein
VAKTPWVTEQTLPIMTSTASRRFDVRFAGLALVLSLGLAGCNYDVPVTVNPTRPVNERLAGNWAAMEGWMKVRAFDANSYAIVHDGKLYRAWHSDVAGLPLVSVQDIDSERRKYAYMVYALSDDGRRLTLRLVNDKIIPAGSKDSDAVQQLFKKHAHEPALFGQDILYIRQ